MENRPVVVGSGPAGLLAGYYLAQKGYRPLILERGFPVKERVPAIRRFDDGGPFEPQNNYLFGEGGADSVGAARDERAGAVALPEVGRTHESAPLSADRDTTRDR